MLRSRGTADSLPDLLGSSQRQLGISCATQRKNDAPGSNRSSASTSRPTRAYDRRPELDLEERHLCPIPERVAAIAALSVLTTVRAKRSLSSAASMV